MKLVSRSLMLICAMGAQACGTTDQGDGDALSSGGALLQPLIADTTPAASVGWNSALIARMESFEVENASLVLSRMREGAVGLIHGAPKLSVRFAGAMADATTYTATQTRDLQFNIDYSLMKPEHVVGEHLSFTRADQSEGDAEKTLRKYCVRSCSEPRVHPEWAGKNCRPVGEVHREGNDHYWQSCQVWEQRPENCAATGGASVHPVAGCDYNHGVVQGRYTSTFHCTLTDAWHCTVATTHTCATHDEGAPTFTAAKSFCHYLAAVLWEKDSADAQPGENLLPQQIRRFELERLLDELHAA